MMPEMYDYQFEELESKVLDWSADRKILTNSTSAVQLMKAMTEMGELMDAELKNHMPGITDGVGDVLVCLINYCAIRGTNVVDCLDAAYEEIKDRKGTLMPNGVFVKE